MKKIGLCNNEGGVGKTTICFCLAGVLAEKGESVFGVDMDQQGSLSSSFLAKIHDLPCTIIDVLLDRNRPIRDCIQKTQCDLIDVAPANLILGRIEAVAVTQLKCRVQYGHFYR